MVSTVLSVSCFMFFYSQCPRAQPFVKVGGTCPYVLWSRRHCSLTPLRQLQKATRESVMAVGKRGVKQTRFRKNSKAWHGVMTDVQAIVLGSRHDKAVSTRGSVTFRLVLFCGS